MKLPMRFRILHLMAGGQEMTSQEVMDALRDEYGDEGQFKPGVINTHLQALRAVGMIEVADVQFDEKGELVEKFKITDYGRSRLKYLPKEWQIA